MSADVTRLRLTAWGSLAANQTERAQVCTLRPMWKGPLRAMTIQNRLFARVCRRTEANLVPATAISISRVVVVTTSDTNTRLAPAVCRQIRANWAVREEKVNSLTSGERSERRCEFTTRYAHQQTAI